MTTLAQNIRATLRRPSSANLLSQWLPQTRPVPDLHTITGIASALGVTREHLSRVLHGHRASRSLTRRYRALKP